MSLELGGTLSVIVLPAMFKWAFSVKGDVVQTGERGQSLANTRGGSRIFVRRGCTSKK